MLRRPLLMLLVLGAAVGGPYVYTNWSSLLKRDASGRSASYDGATSDVSLEELGSPFGRSPSSQNTPASTNSTDVASRLAEVIRLDVTPSWVYQRWNRKTTKLADLEHHGVRVPLVTGTDIGDVAGSLTYFFTQAGQMDHLSFLGTTGDPRPLITLLTSHYNFRPDSPDIAGEFLYQVKWNGHAMSRLRVRPAAVLSTSDPHANYEVELELSHPSSGRYLDLPPPQPVASPEQASLAEDETDKPAQRPAYKVQGPPPHASLYFVPRHVIKKKPE